MSNILIFTTSSDITMDRLIRELGEKRIDCLIQSSQLARYREEYPHINFIDICQEGFFDLPPQVIRKISEKHYDQLYVTFSGVKGHNYGNVMAFVSKVHFQKAFFYNCNGEKTEIPKQNVIKDMLCRVYIAFVSFVYGLRRE